MNDFNQIFRDRTKNLSLQIIRAFSTLPYSDDLSVIRKQLYRCSTSVASNYRATTRARSDKEKYAKICIVVEEADETLFWLEMAEELDYAPKQILHHLKNESEEILKVMASYKKKISEAL